MNVLEVDHNFHISFSSTINVLVDFCSHIYLFRHCVDISRWSTIRNVNDNNIRSEPSDRATLYNNSIDDELMSRCVISNVTSY